MIDLNDYKFTILRMPEDFSSQMLLDKFQRHFSVIHFKEEMAALKRGQNINSIIISEIEENAPALRLQNDGDFWRRSAKSAIFEFSLFDSEDNQLIETQSLGDFNPEDLKCFTHNVLVEILRAKLKENNIKLPDGRYRINVEETVYCYPYDYIFDINESDVENNIIEDYNYEVTNNQFIPV